MNKINKIGWIGTGVMGKSMCKHLISKGYDLSIFSGTASKTAELIDMGAKLHTPSEIATNCDVVFLMLGYPRDVQEVTLGEKGILRNMKKGSYLIDHTTSSPNLAIEIYKEAKSLGINSYDAPVSGGQAGAQNGALTIMCGSDDEAVFQRAKTAIAPYSRACERLGKSGAGQLAKMVNQICIAGIVQGLAEGVNFAQRAGLDVDKLVEVIGKGAAASWQMDNRASTMNRGEFEFGFAVEWMRKDLGICLDEANRNGARLPMTALVDQFYAQVVARGGSRWDTSSLVHLLQND